MTFAEAAMIMMSGGGANIQSLTVTQNGLHNAPAGVDGYNPVDVNVPDRYDEGYKDGYDEGSKDGYDEGYVDGEAAVKAKIQSKTITKNGTYYAADDGLDGFDPVNVNVPDNYDDGYLDGFESAMAYTAGEPDLSKKFYIYIGVQTWESSGEQYVQLNIFNSSDTSNVSKQMSWGYGSDKSFDKTITGIVWSDDKAGTITVYATSYNKAHTEKYTNAPHVFDRLTYDYGITKFNHSIGNTNLE